MKEIPELFKPYVKPCFYDDAPTWWRRAGHPEIAVCTGCAMKHGLCGVNAIPMEVRQKQFALEEVARRETPNE